MNVILRTLFTDIFYRMCSVLCFRRRTDGYPSLDERVPLPTRRQAVHVIQVGLTAPQLTVDPA